MRRFRSWSAFLSLLVGVALLAFLVAALLPMGDQSAETQRSRIEQAVRYAAIQCYALEGAYPPEMTYLKDHYGIRFDESRFFVHYWPNGANIAPDIQVKHSLFEFE
ncbi:MAG: hypothetical protein FWE59_00620 [Oscillospiraceae bacterium]|nr:hypothetical protein [Oscillospiraceae bacterium]